MVQQVAGLVFGCRLVQFLGVLDLTILLHDPIKGLLS